MHEDIENETTKVKVGDNSIIMSNELENGNPFYVILCDN